MVLRDGDYCIICSNTYISYKWCQHCEINKLKKSFTNWSSGEKMIDFFIRGKQSEINKPWDIVFEWIPYDKFLNIEEVDKDDFSTVYSAQWKDGPLYWDENSKQYKRYPKEATLKYSHNLRNVTRFLDEV
jgi:hypothetical protein